MKSSWSGMRWSTSYSLICLTTCRCRVPGSVTAAPGSGNDDGVTLWCRMVEKVGQWPCALNLWWKVPRRSHSLAHFIRFILYSPLSPLSLFLHTFVPPPTTTTATWRCFIISRPITNASTSPSVILLQWTQICFLFPSAAALYNMFGLVETWTHSLDWSTKPRLQVKDIKNWFI